jgi:DNA replication protein DnaC
MMEKLDRILKKTNISKENTPTSTSAEEQAQEPVCELCGGMGWVVADVPYGHHDFGQVFPCKCKQQEMDAERQVRLEYYSNLGPLTHQTFSTLIEAGRSSNLKNQKLFKNALAAAKNFASKIDGWLVLTGCSGCGKTHLAAAIANARIGEGQPALFIVVPDLLDHLRSTFSPSSEISYDNLFNQIINAPLLIMDDLGTQSSTPWAQEKLFQIINHRFNSKLPTIFTTNLSPAELPERLRTRLTDETLSQVLLVGESQHSILSDISPLELKLLKSMSFDNFDSKRLDLPTDQRRNLESAYKQSRSYAEDPTGWLILTGTHGCGKTHLAAAIANHRLQSNNPAEFQIVPEFLDHLRLTFNPDSKVTYDGLFERVKTAPLLILDDLGAQTSTLWAQEKLYQVINYRYNAQLATVITTSLALEEIEERLSSRMCDLKISLVFHIMAPDYRADREPKKAPPKQSARKGR